MDWIRIGAAVMFLGVAAGAFGAHALKTRVEPSLLPVFETGVRYHLLHGLAIFIAAWLGASRAGWSFLAGVVLFSGSLYLMTLTGARWLGAVTPLGGAAFLLGWLFIFLRLK